MESNYIVNMAVLKSFHNNKHDVLNSFVPFVEYAIFKLAKEYMDIEEIQNIIKSECYIDLPITTLKTLLNKLKDKKKVDTYEKVTKIRLLCKYNDEDLEYKDLFEKSNRDKNKLILDYKKYNKIESAEDVYIINLFCDFIVNSIKGKNFSDKEELHSKDNEDLIKISDFIIYTKNYDDYNYKTFQNMYYGFLLYNLTMSQGLSNLANSRKIRKSYIYLDSNFLFRILDLQNPLLNYASYELLNLLRKFKFSLFVFPETIDEVRKVLASKYKKMIAGEIKQKIDSVEAMSIDGIEGAIYRRGMDLSKLDDYIKNIDKEIESLHINISVNHNLSDITIKENDYNKLLKYKIDRHLHLLGFEQSGYKYNFDDIKHGIVKSGDKVLTTNIINNLKSITNHDVRVISFVKNNRKHKIYRFPDINVIFLTCDTSLYRYNSIEHEEYNSIPEIISEEALTNMLWVAFPNTFGDVPLLLSLSVFQSSKFVNYKVFNKFSECVKEYAKNNPDSDNYIGAIYSNQDLMIKLNKLSGNIEENECEDECMDIITEYINSSKEYVKSIKDEYEGKLESREKNVKDEYEGKLETAVGETVRINEKYIYEKYKFYNHNKKIVAKCKHKSKNKMNLLLGLAALIYLIIIILGVCAFNKFQFSKIEPIDCFIGVFIMPFLSFCYFAISKKEFNKREFYNALFEKTLSKEYKKYDIDINEFQMLENEFSNIDNKILEIVISNCSNNIVV